MNQHPAFQAFAVVTQELSPLRKPSSPTRSNRNRARTPNLRHLIAMPPFGRNVVSLPSESTIAMFALLCAACNGLWGNDTCGGSGFDQSDRMASGARGNSIAGSFSSISDRSLQSGRASPSNGAGVEPSRAFFHSVCGC